MTDDKDRSTYQDKMTLDEIADYDMEMTLDAIKNANKYHFGHDMKKAVLFVRHCLDKTLQRLGIKLNPPADRTARRAYERQLDHEMNTRQIRIEHRNQYTGKHTWRCGIYVYQRDVLVAFISDVLTQRKTEFDPISMKIGKETVGYMVITNARLEDTKRIFDMGVGLPKTEAGIILPFAKNL